MQILNANLRILVRKTSFLYYCELFALYVNNMLKEWTFYKSFDRCFIENENIVCLNKFDIFHYYSNLTLICGNNQHL